MDITEIPALSLRQILTQVLAGNTCGTVQIDDDLPFAKVS